MNETELKKSLERLRVELQSTESMDESSKTALVKLKNDIEEYLQRKDYTTEERESMMGNLKESLTYYEGKHPKLAESIHIVIHTLSNMGI